MRFEALRKEDLPEILDNYLGFDPDLQKEVERALEADNAR